MNDWEQTMESIIDLDKDVVVVIGYADIIKQKSHPNRIPLGKHPMVFDNLTTESFYRIIGRGDESDIVEALKECEWDVDSEGEYEFKCIMKWVSGDWEVGEYPYLELKHIEFNFIQTFTQRERESKLNDLFSKSDFNLFN